MKEVELYGYVIENDELCASFLRECGNSVESVTLFPINGNENGYGICDIPVHLSALLVHLAAHCPNLGTFQLKHDEDTPYTHHPELVLLLRQCTKLHTLVLECQYTICNSIFTAMLEAPNLSTVDLLNWFLSEPMSDIPMGLVSSSITQVCCATISFANGDIPILFSHFPKVKNVSIMVLTPAELVAVSKVCSCVVAFHAEITDDDSVTPEVAAVLVKNWPNLIEITLTCASATWLIFVMNCPCLRSGQFGTFSGSTEFFDPALEDYVFPAGYTGSQLCELTVCNLTERELRAVIKHCPYLCTLQLNYSMAQSSFGNTTLAPQALHHLKDSRIKTLTVENYLSLSSADVDVLCGLESLILSASGERLSGQRLCSNALLALATRCPDLKKFHIHNVEHISHNFILPLLDVCPKLTSFMFEVKGTNVPTWTPLHDILRVLIRRLYPQIKSLEIYA